MSQRRMYTPLPLLFPLVAGAVSILFGALLLATAGGFSLWNAIAERWNSPSEKPLISIVTIPAGLTSLEVEQQLTASIEQSIANLAGIAQIRSISNKELSIVNVHARSILVLPTLRRSIEARLESLQRSGHWPRAAHHGPWLLAPGSSMRGQVPSLHDWLVDERSAPVLEVTGPDLVVVQELLLQAAHVLRAVPGVGRVEAPQLFAQSGLSLITDREQLVRHGLSEEDLLQALASFSIRQHAPNLFQISAESGGADHRDSILQTRIPTVTGRYVAVSELATVVDAVEPVVIFRRDLHRLSWIRLHATSDYAQRLAQQQLSNLTLPSGYTRSWRLDLTPTSPRTTSLLKSRPSFATP